MLAEIALLKLLQEYDFKTVLDVGFGDGLQAKKFAEHGKNVTAIDYNPRVSRIENVNIINVDFISHIKTIGKFDCVWCSHVLEHQFDPRQFLSKIHQIIKPNGVIAITVPPMKHQIVGGHVSWWNAGKLLYMLILAGFDCSDARIKTYGYNISLIMNYKPIVDFNWAELKYNKDDLIKLKDYFPIDIKGYEFDGNIKELNWQ